MSKLLFDELTSLKENYHTTSIDLAEGLSFNQARTLKMIEFYSNSKYLGGDKDELGRDKPYLNIINANVDVSVVATDLDTKDIQIQGSDRDSYAKAYILSKAGKNWMRDVNYAKHLNERGETRARYGGVLIKKTEVDGKLDIQVVPWKNLITNPTDILKNTIVEQHFLSPAELSDKSEVWKKTEEAIKIAVKTKEPYLVHEIHGRFPVAVYKECKGEKLEETDKYTYKNYHFVVSGEKGKQLIHWSEEEKDLPYKYLPWKAIPGRALGKGVVEEGEQAQIWTNDAVIAEKNVMELAGKVIVQTASKKYAGRNIFTEMDNGTTLEHEENKPFSRVELTPSSLPVWRDLISRWQSQFDRSTAVTDALRGETPPSGQAFRLQALVTQQSASQFDYRREEAGIFEKEVWTDWIIPHLIKKLSKPQTLVSEFSNDELQKIDETFLNSLIFEQLNKAVSSGQIVDPAQIEQEKQSIREKLMITGSHRFLELPEDFFKGIKVLVDVITTGEQKNKTAMLESLATIFGQVQSTFNPQTGKFAALEDPVLAEIFYSMVEAAGTDISPVALEAKSRMSNPTTPQAIPAQSLEQPSTLVDPATVATEAQQTEQVVA